MGFWCFLFDRGLFFSCSLFFLFLADTMVRRAYVSKGDAASPKEMLRSPMFVIGILLTVVLDPVCTFVALLFAPSVSLLSPLLVSIISYPRAQTTEGVWSRNGTIPRKTGLGEASKHTSARGLEYLQPDQHRNSWMRRDSIPPLPHALPGCCLTQDLRSSSTCLSFEHLHVYFYVDTCT